MVSNCIRNTAQGSTKEQAIATIPAREFALPCSPSMLIILILRLHSTSYQLWQTRPLLACFDFITCTEERPAIPGSRGPWQIIKNDSLIKRKIATDNLAPQKNKPFHKIVIFLLKSPNKIIVTQFLKVKKIPTQPSSFPHKPFSRLMI